MKKNPEIKPEKSLDCTGLYCPEPLFQTRLQLDTLEENQLLEVLADDPAAEEDIKRLCKRTGNQIIRLEKKGDTIRFLIKKGKQEA
ncbi:MAG: sulfurtransferase TusA family protein [Candidatus Aminicenantes bacterium]|nr:sulfurtransferase TusA family protein [Candidatus Aminicenantes bacterium]